MSQFGWLRPLSLPEHKQQQYYPHVLREIIDVGIVDSTGFQTGTMSVTYADAYDNQISSASRFENTLTGSR